MVTVYQDTEYNKFPCPVNSFLCYYKDKTTGYYFPMRGKILYDAGYYYCPYIPQDLDGARISVQEA